MFCIFSSCWFIKGRRVRSKTLKSMRETMNEYVDDEPMDTSIAGKTWVQSESEYSEDEGSVRGMGSMVYDFRESRDNSRIVTVEEEKEEPENAKRLRKRLRRKERFQEKETVRDKGSILTRKGYYSGRNNRDSIE